MKIYDYEIYNDKVDNICCIGTYGVRIVARISDSVNTICSAHL